MTPTDVAQAEARLARGTADLNAAEVNLAIEQATYEQIIGIPPGRLVPSAPIDRLLPTSRDQAIAVARRENPAVLGASYDIDVTQYAIRVAESALYPTITAQGYLLNSQNTDVNLDVAKSSQAGLIGNLNIPIYDGGQASAQVRQAKEVLSQARMVDDPRGWFQWYCRYYMGWRMPEEDARQIGRWKAMKRHVAQIRRHCEPGDPMCRRRQRQALLHWAYDSRRI